MKFIISLLNDVYAISDFRHVDSSSFSHLEKNIIMSIIHYRTPQTVSWPTVGRWSNLRDDLNILFELPFRAGSERHRQLFSGWSPALDLYQDKDNVVATLELPGMRKEEIEISLHDGTLTISGERKAESAAHQKPERTECYVGKFRRSITLPTRIDVEKVSASYRDGILTVTMPKAEEAKPKQIQVNVS